MDTKIITVSSAKTKIANKRRARLRLSGLWLNTINFQYNTLVTVTYDEGYLIFKASGSGTDTYTKLVKGVLKNGLGLIQVRYTKANGKDVPGFEVKGRWLEDLGFTIGSVVVVQSQRAMIKVRLLDLTKLDLGNEI